MGDAWVGVVGALAGAAIALIGQYFTGRAAQRERAATLLLDQCAQMVAMSEDYRNRIWEERRLGTADAVAGWKIADYRLAEARMRILCKDRPVEEAIARLRRAGVELGKAWRMDRSNENRVDAAWNEYRESIDHFALASGKLVRSRLF